MSSITCGPLLFSHYTQLPPHVVRNSRPSVDTRYYIYKIILCTDINFGKKLLGDKISLYGIHVLAFAVESRRIVLNKRKEQTKRRKKGGFRHGWARRIKDTVCATKLYQIPRIFLPIYFTRSTIRRYPYFFFSFYSQTARLKLKNDFL